ncbi:ANTAR domain-containing protein [Amycolatopsis sp. NPDC023774]|uniref:ANTAR domain-containing protein n=1 Tax=Amycolatopsis sp. NPDC023774 TaxID=3155015 RepID=UPI0033C0B75D
MMKSQEFTDAVRREEAFGVLVTLSQDTNVKLRDVARAFLDEFLATLPAEPQGGPTASA